MRRLQSTLPIHGSQFELERNDEYSIFGFYVAPTYDFIQELRKFGSTLEVLEPAHLRDEFKEKSENLAKMYEKWHIFCMTDFWCQFDVLIL